MLDALVMTVALAVPSDSADREWAVQRPNRGGVGRFMDTNVRAVWGGVPFEVRRFLSCVAQHESHHNPNAENGGRWGGSTAAGKYQFLDGTWQGIARWTKVNGKYVARGYSHASDAPAWIQEAVAIHSVLDDGWLNWRGTHCGHGT